jgi:hypothetical protein
LLAVAGPEESLIFAWGITAPVGSVTTIVTDAALFASWVESKGQTAMSTNAIKVDALIFIVLVAWRRFLE